MLSVEDILKLDPELASLSPTELQELRDAYYQIAQLGFETYWAKKGGSKYPVGLFPSSQEGSTL